MTENCPIQQRVLAAFLQFLKDVDLGADDPSVVLSLCDQIRDDVMPYFGIRVEDDSYQKGSSVWKLDSVSAILADKEQKKKDAEIAAKKKAENQKKKEEAERKKRELASLDPSEFFMKHPTWSGKFATYNEEGFPLTTADGKPLSKGLVKKTTAALAKHKAQNK